MTNEEIFKVFLKKHRKLTTFKEKVKSMRPPQNIRGVDNRKDLHCKDAIYDSFVWDDTVEGWGYWSNLNGKWIKLCDEFNLDGSINILDIQ